MQKYFALLTFLIPSAPVFCQQDSLQKKSPQAIFEKITTELKEYKPDTSAVPYDEITKKIKELRELRGGFNINEALAFRLEEDRQKNELSEEEFKKLHSFFVSGDGSRWLDNAVTWIYRSRFNYDELQQLVEFYKTPAGQKMAEGFPFVMLQSLAAAQMIKDIYVQSYRR